LNTLEGIIRQAERESDREASETAAAVRAVLSRLGYVSKKGLARKARGLREVVAPSGIVLSELYESGAFDRLGPEDLAEVISWFASDARRRRDNTYRLPKDLARLRRQAVDTYNKIAAMEETEGIELAQGPSPWFYGVAFAWCHGDSIEDITTNIELGEGDVVSVLNKTVDLLDQLESMLTQYGDYRLIAISSEARRLLVRGLVAMVRSGDHFLDRDEAGTVVSALS
jgi:superfamily II RNA helicase